MAIEKFISRFPINMEGYSTDEINRIVAHILSNMSLKEKSLIAHMNAKSLPYLQYAFDMYIDREIGDKPELGRKIIKCVWQKLQETHRIRLAK